MAQVRSSGSSKADLGDRRGREILGAVESLPWSVGEGASSESTVGGRGADCNWDVLPESWLRWSVHQVG